MPQIPRQKHGPKLSNEPPRAFEITLNRAVRILISDKFVSMSLNRQKLHFQVTDDGANCLAEAQ